MKKSTQWDLVGVFALLMGFGMLLTSLFTARLPLPITPINRFIIVLFGNPFIAVFAIVWSFMCFIFGFFESKKEERNLSQEN